MVWSVGCACTLKVSCPGHLACSVSWYVLSHSSRSSSTTTLSSTRVTRMPRSFRKRKSRSSTRSSARMQAMLGQRATPAVLISRALRWRALLGAGGGGCDARLGTTGR